MILGSELVIKTVELIELDEAKTTVQPKDQDLKTAYKLNKENCKIDWTESLDNIYNKIRGLNPFPSAWCYLLNNEEKMAIKLFNVSKLDEMHNHQNGEVIIDNNEIKVACKNGCIKVLEIQLPGKRKMDIKSLLNGFSLDKNAKML